MDSMVHRSWKEASLLALYHFYAVGDGICGNFGELQSTFAFAVLPRHGNGSQR